MLNNVKRTHPVLASVRLYLFEDIEADKMWFNQLSEHFKTEDCHIIIIRRC